MAGRRVYLDTNVLIYLIEGHEDFGPLASDFLVTEKAQGSTLIVSDLCRVECLMGPARQNNTRLLTQYEGFFAEAGDFTALEFLPHALEQVPELARHFSLRLVDAMHLSLALQAGCAAFATNDRGFANADSIIDLEYLT